MFFMWIKSHFIKKWWESKDYVTLITRPRRFGKTLNMLKDKDYVSARQSVCEWIVDPYNEYDYLYEGSLEVNIRYMYSKSYLHYPKDA